MVEENRSTIVRFAGPSPDMTTTGDSLSTTRFRELHRVVREEGLPCFGRLNEVGQAELYLIFDDINSFSESVDGVSTVEFRLHGRELLLIVWTKSDPHSPLGFPLSFTVERDWEQEWLHQLLGQDTTNIFFLAVEYGELLHIFTEQVMITAEESAGVFDFIQELHEREEFSHPINQALPEERIATPSVYAHGLHDDLFILPGQAYLIDYRKHVSDQGERAEESLMETLHQALEAARCHPIGEARDKSYTIWVKGDENEVAVYITPSLQAGGIRNEDDPFLAYFKRLSSFLGVREGTPLREGAFPIFRKEGEQLLHLELDDTSAIHFSRLFLSNWDGLPDPFVRK
ncbi:hypothetical protein [Brevibacillus daliensis]|uniref:hypothetical protein n=1 Tax=Brevibacillus daliensis TaxID=2892995 RepID=UPI001E343A62|nr:hypothetical protein [Brevibacillus daliensis]